MQDANFVNDNEFRIIGMSRSGNHAIINWIMRQAHGRLCFLNCAEPKFNPFTTARSLPHGDAHIVNYDDFDIDAERRGVFSGKDYLLHSYEDCFLGTLSSNAVAAQRDAWVGASRRRLNVLILRDPFNLFASRRKADVGEVGDAVARRIWKQHAREFLGVRRYLDEPSLYINYNRWMIDVAYRQDVARQLGLTFTDAGAHAPPSFGPASAFDPAAARRHRLLQRWRHYENDSDYRRLFDPETVSLASRIFDTDQELERRLLCVS